MRILLILFAFVWSFGVGAPSFAADAVDRGTVTYTPDVTFTLRTNIADGKLVFVGDAGAISGKINPDLQVPENSVVQKSEEHTSELQSLMRISYAVFCLKKKKKKTRITY